MTRPPDADLLPPCFQTSASPRKSFASSLHPQSVPMPLSLQLLPAPDCLLHPGSARSWGCFFRGFHALLYLLFARSICSCASFFADSTCSCAVFFTASICSCASFLADSTCSCAVFFSLDCPSCASFLADSTCSCAFFFTASICSCASFFHTLDLRLYSFLAASACSAASFAHLLCCLQFFLADGVRSLRTLEFHLGADHLMFQTVCLFFHLFCRMQVPSHSFSLK